MANRGKPQPRQMDGPRLEHDLYRIQGRRNTDTATYSLISTVTLTTQVQRPLIIVRHPNESVNDYVWWRYCKHLRYVEDDNRLWRLLSYGTWHHRLVGRNGVPSQTKAPFKVTTVRTLNHATAIIQFFFSTSSSFSFSSQSDFFRFSHPIPSPFLSIFCLSVY